MPSLKSIMQTALNQDTEALFSSPIHIEQQVAALRARFAAEDAAMSAKARVAAALQRLPADRRTGWLAGAEAALSVALSELRRGSRLLLEAGRELLPVVPAGWDLVPAGAGTVRGAAVGSVVAVGQDGATLRLIADDAGTERRILVTLAGVDAAMPVPVLLVIGDDPAVEPLECDPEIETAPSGARTLRYEAVLPPGLYHVFLGNSRASAAGGDDV